MSLAVQGSNLYFRDPTNNAIVEVGCVTTISGIGASRDQNDVTCISDETRRLEAGLLNPGTASFGIYFDPTDTSHTRLHELYREGTTLEWALGMSDGTAAPTGVNSNGIALPTSRTFLTFEGYVSDFPWEFAIGQKVANQLALQISDFPVVHPKV